MSISKKILRLIDPLIRLPVVGLDISDRTAKYLKLNLDGKISFDAFGEIEIPAGLIEAGEVKDEDKLVEVFIKWGKDVGRRVSSSLIVASLPEEKSFVRLIQLPKVKLGDVRNAVRWEIEANIPLPQENLIYDYEVIEPLENHLDHIDVVITAFPKDIVNHYASVLRRAGLKLAVLELESQAIVRALIPNLRERKAKIIVDIGKTRTSLITLAGGAITFTYTVQLGGNTFEENISRALKTDLNKAKELKEGVGLNKVKEGGQIFSALVPVISVLVDEIKRMLADYQKHTEHYHGATRTVDEIILVGGDANLHGLDTFIASEIRIPVSLGDSTINIAPKITSSFPAIPKNQSLAFATATGLALREIS